MPLPLIGTNGLLPPFIGDSPTTADRSPYFVSIRDLVERFGTTPHRRQLLRNLIAYRQLLASDGYVEGYQFIDGSFVEDIERIRNRPPNDLDVISFLNVPEKYQGDFDAWNKTGVPFWFTEIIDESKNMQRYKLHTFALLIDEATLPRVLYWYGLFSHQRDTLAWKGFAAVLLDAVGDQAALVALESA